MLMETVLLSRNSGPRTWSCILKDDDFLSDSTLFANNRINVMSIVLIDSKCWTVIRWLQNFLKSLHCHTWLMWLSLAETNSDGVLRHISCVEASQDMVFQVSVLAWSRHVYGSVSWLYIFCCPPATMQHRSAPIIHAFRLDCLFTCTEQELVTFCYVIVPSNKY